MTAGTSRVFGRAALNEAQSGVGLEERGSGEQSGWREGVEKEANNNHHGATNPLKGDGWSKDGERGETEGDGGALARWPVVGVSHSHHFHLHPAAFMPDGNSSSPLSENNTLGIVS
ncbi:unnamed protein product [Pleuronectes platessa]|uniref:Uncharacterized protein n=1 Tax=Pleuronectes platessa TaxID=8262 RepID=A0A9N7UXC2_PLEPL|nr:unnamed protein product [Pleuronectes platessa]